MGDSVDLRLAQPQEAVLPQVDPVASDDEGRQASHVRAKDRLRGSGTSPLSSPLGQAVNDVDESLEAAPLEEQLLPDRTRLPDDVGEDRARCLLDVPGGSGVPRSPRSGAIRPC